MTRRRLTLRRRPASPRRWCSAGCSFDVYKLPLPGGPDVGERPDHGDRPVPRRARPRARLDRQGQRRHGRQDHRRLAEGLHRAGHDAAAQRHRAARQRRRRRSSRPACSARSSCSSPRPTSGASPNPLKSGDIIPIAHTGQNPEVEQVLGALSLLLNGGGVGQLQTITRELDRTLHGREGDARSVLHQVRSFAGQLDRHKHDIVQALQALDRLSRSLNQQRTTIDATLDELPGALQSINTQRHDLVRMLQALVHLSGVGVHVIRLSKDVDDRHPAAAEPGAGPAPGVGRRLRQGLQRRPHLPVRRRGRRP